MAKINPFAIKQGKSKDFIYVGELIPNQVLVTNLTSSATASFELTSGAKSWTYTGTIGKGRTKSILVRWPSGRARFTNNSVADATIEVGGDGIFPAYGKAKAVKAIITAIKKKK